MSAKWYIVAVICGLLNLTAPPPSGQPLSVKFQVRKDPSSGFWRITDDNLQNGQGSVSGSRVVITKGLISIPADLCQDTLCLANKLFKNGRFDRQLHSSVSFGFESHVLKKVDYVTSKDGKGEAFVHFNGSENVTTPGNKATFWRKGHRFGGYRITPKEEQLTAELSTEAKGPWSFAILYQALMETPLSPLEPGVTPTTAQVTLCVQILTPTSHRKAPKMTTSFVLPVPEGQDIEASVALATSTAWNYAKLLFQGKNSYFKALAYAEARLNGSTDFRTWASAFSQEMKTAGFEKYKKGLQNGVQAVKMVLTGAGILMVGFILNGSVNRYDGAEYFLVAYETVLAFHYVVALLLPAFM